MRHASVIYWRWRGLALGCAVWAMALGMLVLPAAAEQYVPALLKTFDDPPTSLADVNGTLFLSAESGSTGVELWKSDGSVGGTVLVKDIRSGRDSSPSRLTNIGGTLFFRANDGSTGVDLWKSDGTEAGTMLVADINFATSSSNPDFLTNLNGTVYFTATNGTPAQGGNGIELWRSDGTNEGTVLVKDINLGGNSAIDSITNVNGTLYFRANEGIFGLELWKSDGTDGGTMMVKDIHPAGNSNIQFMTNVNGTLYFNATNGSLAQGGNGFELWKSDGTEAGTVLVKDINLLDNNVNAGAYPQHLAGVGSTLFFAADDGPPGHGIELWKSDGTEAGTVLVKDIRPGLSSGDPQGMIDFNGTLFFRANNGTNGIELWKSDGTEAGTVLAAELSPGSASTTFANDSFRVVGDKMFFVATPTGSLPRLFVTDGTSAGTESLFTAASIANLTVSGSYLYFTSGDSLFSMPLFDALTPGDFDGDGDVDGADFVAWQTNFPTQSGASRADGDANGDDKVDGADFAVWQDSFSSAAGGGTSPVPEPNTALIALTAAALLAAGRTGRVWFVRHDS